MGSDQLSASGVHPAEGEAYPRLVRVREGRLLAGVSTGLARFTGIDPVVVRVAFVLLVLGGGEGIAVYIAAVLLMANEPAGLAPAERVLRRRFDAAAVLSILAALLALMIAGKVIGTRLADDPATVVTVFALILLAAHSRGVSLVQAARDLPERLSGHPLHLDGEPHAQATAATAPVSLDKAGAPAGSPLPPGMVDLAAYSAVDDLPPEPTAAAWRKAPTMPTMPAALRPRSALTPVTLLLAMCAAAAVSPATSGFTPVQRFQMITATALAVLGAGLVVGGWAGRPRGLTAVGTLLTVGLLTSTAAAQMPSDARYGEFSWRPTEIVPTQQNYRVGVGSGRLVLTGLPLRPGQRVMINAELVVGELTVVLPPDARVELDGRVAMGDLTIDKRVLSGPGSKTTETLAPLTRNVPDPPVIELRIRAKLGDVKVTRDA